MCVSRALRSAASPRRPDDDDSIKINLGDIPRMQETLDIEGFKPTLLSRLFDLVAPLR